MKKFSIYVKSPVSAPYVIGQCDSFDITLVEGYVICYDENGQRSYVIEKGSFAFLATNEKESA